MRVLTFEICTEPGRRARIRLCGPGDDRGDAIEADFDESLLEGRRLETVADKLDRGRVTRDELKEIGSQLWASLLAPEIEQRLENVLRELRSGGDLVQVRLLLPSELQALPWEALYDEHELGFLTGDNPRFCVVRGAGEQFASPSEERGAGKLSVLVVVPEGSGLDVRRELQNLRHAVARVGDAIDVHPFEGRVTPERLADKLAERSWDVVHYIGHGEVVDGSVRIRLNDEERAGDEHLVEGENFASLFRAQPVRLVVLNCCYGGYSSVGESRSLSGLGPYLLRAGVPAVVAMRYEVDDADAVRFSRRFYTELLSGAEPGRIDHALLAARRSLFVNQRDDAVRSFVTPVLFLTEGGERLAGLETVAPEGFDAEPPVAAVPCRGNGFELPDDLREGVANGRCIPVVGAQILRADAQRSQQSPPGPRRLIQLLIQHVPYPVAAECEGLDRLHDHEAEQLLQRVCQHVQFVNGQSTWKLFEWLRQAYERCLPPPIFRSLAKWPSPGWIYTFYDGFLAEAAQHEAQLAGRPVRVLNRADQELGTSEPAPVVLNLRGTVSEPGSLVLTEQEHESLHEKMNVLSPSLSDLVHKQIGRSLVLIGVSPRDPTVRLLVNRLLPEGRTERTKTLGPIYFVAAERNPVDEAYWSRFGVLWVEADPSVAVAALTTGGAPA